LKQRIKGFFKDDENDWVAKLSCGHTQHVRHAPPWQLRPWVVTKTGREAHIDHQLDCKKCDRNEAKDFDL
jgi:hypothetical protein